MLSTRKLATIAVTELSLGGAGIGNLYRVVGPDDAQATLEAAWRGGMRLFDTAPFYGFGLSERRVGDFLRGQAPGSFVLSTKVGRLLRPVPRAQVPDHGYADPLPFTLDYDYSYDGVMRSLEMSYARLGLNRIDIVWVHDIGAETHGAEANRAHMRALLDGGIRALEELKQAGTIAAYGLGVNEAQVCLDVLAHASLDAILLAGRYSLLDRSAASQLLPLCQERGTVLVIGGVFNSGILATGPVPGAHFNYKPASADVLARVTALEDVAKRFGVPLAAAALQFPLRHPAVASVLIGTAKPSSLRRNFELFSISIPEPMWAACEAHAIH